MAAPNDCKTKFILLDVEDPSTDRRCWMGKSPEERLDAVEFLREQFYVIQGYSEPPRIQKTAHVKDLADLELLEEKPRPAPKPKKRPRPRKKPIGP